MSYAATVFNVMIASPGDVASERAIVREVVHEWNAVHAEKRRIVLLPIGWETHASPEMGARPQSIINRQITDRCDLLIGVFWTRIGTRTDDYESGTVEEIERHIGAGRPAMLYFSSQPVNYDSVDPEQAKRLKAFKQSCQARGLYEAYDSLSEFKEKVYRHLQLKVNEHPLFEVSTEAAVDLGIAESRHRMPELSREARVLLKEASLDSSGIIVRARYIGGTSIQANGKNMLASTDRREVARWEAAIELLTQHDLIVERGHKGEVFEITETGYQLAEMISL